MKLPLAASMLAMLVFSSTVARAAVQPSPAGSTRQSAALSVGASATPHRFFGLLQNVKGVALTLRLRNGRLLLVDATQAYALKRVSAPLFFGKPTVVQGTFTTNGVLRATIVKRAAPLVQSWGVDQ